LVIAETFRHFSIFTAVKVGESKVLVSLGDLLMQLVEIEEKRG